MNNTIKIFVSIVLLLSFSFMCIGYARVFDDFNFTGKAYVEPVVVIDYLHISDARIQSSESNDTIISKGGSQDSANPMGWVMLNLDFTKSLTKTVVVTVKNSNPTIKYSFYEPRCVSSYNSDTVFTATVESGITGGTLNSQGLVVDGTEINPGGSSIDEIVLTVTSSEPIVASVTLQMIFGFKGEADKGEAENQSTVKNALEKFNESLNINTMFDRIIDEMGNNGAFGLNGNYVGNVVGSGSSDTQLIQDIFGDTLQKVSFSEDSGEQTCTVMIKYKNVTDNYSNPRNNNEMVLYLTTEDPTTKKSSSLFSKGGLISVFAVVFAYDSSASRWFQYGDIYSGDANVNAYSFPNYGNDSFDTESWRALNNQTFTIVKDGTEIQYTVYDNDKIDTIIQDRYEPAIGK